MRENPYAPPLFLLVVVIVLAIFGITFDFALENYKSAGAFGDSFGVVTSLFSGLTLVFLVIAVLIQRQELQTVREERDDTRKLLEAQNELNALQEAALRRQLEEQSLFNLVSLAANERKRLDRQYATTDHTLTEVSYFDAKSRLKSLRDFLEDGSEPLSTKKLKDLGFYQNLDRYDEFRSIFTQIIAVSVFVEDSEQLQNLGNDLDRTVFESLINTHLATIWAFMAISETRKGSSFERAVLVSRFKKQLVGAFIEDELRSVVEVALDRGVYFDL